MNLLRELEAASAAARLNPPTLKLPRRNPRPPGVPRRGSASDAVLTYLQGESGFRTHAQIVSGINRKREAEDAKPLSIKATAWALLFLRRTGYIEGFGDSSRNPRYLRYRIKAHPDVGATSAKGVDEVLTQRAGRNNPGPATDHPWRW